MYKGKSCTFFRQSRFRVVRTGNGKSGSDKKRTPRIEITDSVHFLAVKLAKLGYFNGNPKEVLQAPLNIVLDILDYEDFEKDYIDEYDRLNRSEE